jgi:excinuclease ABC subunit C
VRLAISGLDRLFRLSYTGDRLTPAEREMAGVRDVEPAHRPGVVAALTAVLERDPDAVTAAERDLRGHRDAAAASLRFELAARIQEELRALNWVTSPQLATVSGGGDAEPWGWHDGVEIRMQVREGRLCDWEQGPCERPGRGVRGPGIWAPFVRRNAELAEALAGNAQDTAGR